MLFATRRKEGSTAVSAVKKKLNPSLIENSDYELLRDSVKSIPVVTFIPEAVKVMLIRAVGPKDSRTSGTILAWEKACVTFAREDGEIDCAKPVDNMNPRKSSLKLKCGIAT